MFLTALARSLQFTIGFALYLGMFISSLSITRGSGFLFLSALHPLGMIIHQFVESIFSKMRFINEIISGISLCSCPSRRREKLVAMSSRDIPGGTETARAVRSQGSNEECKIQREVTQRVGGRVFYIGTTKVGASTCKTDRKGQTDLTASSNPLDLVVLIQVQQPGISESGAK